jgi:hydroxymethylpyrimidine pyrophosphatase-like HAD family hydrolase
MLQTAGIGVCMANGLDSAKAIADYVTDSCDEDGVAKAIYRFCK